jgi:flavodoxin
MNSVVVIYYSKSGNTRQIAEVIAEAVGCEALPLNLVHKGRLSRQEAALEGSYFNDALGKARAAEGIIIGTPTEFRKPHPVIVDFIRRASIRQAAVFCTYYGILGGTLLDLVALLRQRGVTLTGTLAIRLGTEAYRFRENINNYVEEITPANLEAARHFSAACSTNPQPLPIRLRGVCSNDCTACASFQTGKCPGAGFNCWSGRECEIYKCCVLKKSLPDCSLCSNFKDCVLNQRRSLAASPL